MVQPIGHTVRLGVTSRVIIRPLPEQLWPLALPVLERVDGRSTLQDGLRELAVVEPDVAQDGLLQVLPAVEVVALEYVFDPAVKALDQTVGLQAHWWSQAVLDVEVSAEPVEVVVAGGRAPRQAERRSVNALPLSVSTRVIFIGAARSRSRRNRRALAAVLAG